VAALAATARSVGAAMESLMTAPEFRRFLLRRGTSSVIVELVRDRAPQVFPDKPVVGTIRVDPPEGASAPT
jgi:hypothetical protein